MHLDINTSCHANNGTVSDLAWHETTRLLHVFTKKLTHIFPAS